MVIRDYKKQDKKPVEEIFTLYWNDPEFLTELTSYLKTEGTEVGFIVAEEDGEIVGIAGYKELSDYLRQFASVDNAVELYVIAAKYKDRGIGIELKTRLVQYAKEQGFVEMLLFSPDTHKDSWSFHDTLNFERMGEVTPPDDGKGQVWRKVL